MIHHVRIFKKSTILGTAPIDGLLWMTAKSGSSLWSSKVDAEIWTFLHLETVGIRSRFRLYCIKTYVRKLYPCGIIYKLHIEYYPSCNLKYWISCMKFSGFSHMKNAEICICMKQACFRCYNSSRALILSLPAVMPKIIYSASVSTWRLLALTVVQNLINSLLTEMIIQMYMYIYV